MKYYVDKLDIPELIGKKYSNIYSKDIEKLVKDKIILITGGAGSIGFNLLNELLQYDFKKIVILDFCENGIFKVENMIAKRRIEKKCEAILCNITNLNRLNQIFSDIKPDFVIHTAAYKHVPIMEKNTVEAITNNIIGTYNLVQMCEKYNVDKFLLISTDKAVYPVNIMGATKRICEELIRSMKNSKHTKYMAVRFGNVVESSGSLTQIIKEQIKNEETITITDENMKRYFMSIDEAVYLILLTLCYTDSGYIYLLDMGEPIKIYDLVLKIIKKVNLENNKKITIKNIGIRPGEKLEEKLHYDTELQIKTKYNRIFRLEDYNKNTYDIKQKIETIKDIIENDYQNIDKVYNIITSIIPTYVRNKE